MVEEPLIIPPVVNAGTSEGARKAWDTRGRGQHEGDPDKPSDPNDRHADYAEIARAEAGA
jgi:hypothetical protein